MSHIYSNSCGDAWFKYLKMIVNYGIINHDSIQMILECDYALIEIESFLSKDTIIERFADDKLIDLYYQKLFNIEVIQPFKFSYGKRLFNQNGINQVDWIIKILKTKKESKSASISLLTPNEIYGEVPCLISVTAKIRNDKLLLTCVFRSQNVLRSYANFIALRKLQEFISEKLSYPPGRLLFFINSPHLYLEDLDFAKSVIKRIYEKL